MSDPPPLNVRLLTAFVILTCAIVVIYPLSSRLAGQLHVHKANQYLHNAQYLAAVDSLLKAVPRIPNDFEVRNSLANALYKAGVEDLENHEALTRFKKARESYQQALHLNPLDARSAYGLARAEIRLEQYTRTRERKAVALPTPALQALERAVALRPASTAYRLTLARYLYLHNEMTRLLSEIQSIGRFQPASYAMIRRQPFWSEQARTAFLAGVEVALAEDILPRQTRLTIAKIMADERRWQKAIDYQQEGMKIQPSLNTAADYIRLGYFYVLINQPTQALSSFFQGLGKSSNIEQDIINILRTCKNGNDAATLVDFYNQASKKYGNSTTMDLAAARYLFALKEFDQSAVILAAANNRQPDGEAYYWQSRIAEVQQDWDTAELMIQKATVHDPQNSHYHLRFSHILNRLQKYERAERQAGLAIQHQQNISAGLFHYRAGLRMRLKNYNGAMQDSLKAVELEPGNKAYQLQLARVKKLIGEE